MYFSTIIESFHEYFSMPLDISKAKKHRSEEDAINSMYLVHHIITAGNGHPE
jgi:hypothetical protein